MMLKHQSSHTESVRCAFSRNYAYMWLNSQLSVKLDTVSVEMTAIYFLNEEYEVKVYEGRKTCVVRADSCLFSKHFVYTSDS